MQPWADSTTICLNFVDHDREFPLERARKRRGNNCLWYHCSLSSAIPLTDKRFGKLILESWENASEMFDGNRKRNENAHLGTLLADLGEEGWREERNGSSNGKSGDVFIEKLISAKGLKLFRFYYNSCYALVFRRKMSRKACSEIVDEIKMSTTFRERSNGDQLIEKLANPKRLKSFPIIYVADMTKWMAKVKEVLKEEAKKRLLKN